jgi:hypothetical protein
MAGTFWPNSDVARRTVRPKLVDVHPPTANATVPKHTSAYLSTRLTNGCSGDTDATNSCPKGTAAKGDLSY